VQVVVVEEEEEEEEEGRLLPHPWLLLLLLLVAARCTPFGAALARPSKSVTVCGSAACERRDTQMWCAGGCCWLLLWWWCGSEVSCPCFTCSTVDGAAAARLYSMYICVAGWS
jgi:hypothetical protein